MFDKKRFQFALENYKKDFPTWWQEEKYKWEAVKCFQDNWNIDANNFEGMLRRALSKTYNLLASANNFSAEMIIEFAKIFPERVQEIFAQLFDEKIFIFERVSQFKTTSDKLLKNYLKNTDSKYKNAKSHYQTENSISTYLWLRYPNKYYIYKFTEVKTISSFLEYPHLFKRGAYEDNIKNFLLFYDELSNELKLDKQIVEMLKNNLTDECYNDFELKTLTIDFGYYVTQSYNRLLKDWRNNFNTTDEWFPKNYSPNLSVEDWKNLLNDRNIFSESDLEVMKCLQDFGGAATCKQLSERYGETVNFYNNKVWSIGSRIVKKINCPVSKREDGSVQYWAILCFGRDADSSELGSFVWKLRDELFEALKEIDLSDIKLYAENKKIEPYNAEKFLSEVFISAEKYNMLVEVLKRKKNIILQGAPGTGKTFAAKRLAYSMLGEKDDRKIEFVQFHQNYSYEDFVAGWRPTENNFELRTGIFYNFCKKAEMQPTEKFFFIIDEINRGNLSKIFGELLMLIESDKRGEKISLAYEPDKNFSVPENLYIIGMMNTADRSLALIDYALRRRFSFFEMIPAFDSEGFKNYQATLNNKIFDKLIEQIKILNVEISKSLGKGFCIGHSYFCDAKSFSAEILKSIVDYEILPMLEEYFFDDAEKFQRWEKNLQGVFND